LLTTVEFALLTFSDITPPVPDNIFSRRTHCLSSRTQTRLPSLITPKTGLTSRLSLVAGPLIPASRPLALVNQLPAGQRNTKHQTPNHQIKAREHVSSSTAKHHVKREQHLHLSFSYKADPLPERRCTNSTANRPAAAARPPHKHRSPHSTTPTPTQTARCLALRALRSASIPMAP
jgi:hypothetical protein